MSNGLYKQKMKGASIAECVLALAVFVMLAVFVPVLEERGLVDVAPDQVETAPTPAGEASPVHVATDEEEVEHSHADRIEVAAAHTPPDPLSLATLH